MWIPTDAGSGFSHHNNVAARLMLPLKLQDNPSVQHQQNFTTDQEDL